MKIHKLLLFIAFLCLTIGAHAESKPLSAKHYAYWLQSLCQAKPGDDGFTVRMSMCRGFILGVTSAVDGRSMNTPAGTLSVSVSPVDVDAFIADYLLWLDTHDKDKNEEASSIVLRVLISTGNASLTRTVPEAH